MVAHLQEAPVEPTILANEHCIDRGRHVVVDPTHACSAKEGEGAGMGVEHHLPRLARIGGDKEHPAVAEPDVRDLHRRCGAGNDDHLMAPVELIGLTGIEAQRHERGRGPAGLRALPAAAMATNSVVSAFISEALKLLVKPHQRQPLAPRLALVLRQQPLQIGDVRA